jgi:hypothetical protein
MQKPALECGRRWIVPLKAVEPRFKETVMHRLKRPLLAFALAAALPALAMAESIENPSYTYWSKFKVGTSVTLKGTANGKDMTMIEKLVDVTADKCVVEMTSTIGDKKVPVMKRDVERELTDEDAIKTYKEETAHSTTETITTPAGTFTCKEYTVENDDVGKMEVWVSEDVPGGDVKSIHTFSVMGKEMGGKTELVAMEKK